MSNVTLSRGIRLGLIGGLVGTIVMDLVMVGMFSIMGLPAGTFFSFIGTAAGTFLSLIGITIGGGIPLGAVLHYLIGLLLGLIFGAVVSQVDVLRLDTPRKGMLLGVIYTEIGSIVLLLPAAMILRMAVPEMLELFGLSFIFHLVWGIVLGGFVSYGIRSRIRSMGVSTSK